MSYCRWSSDDYQCDVYVYEDCGGGYRIHVASGRYVFTAPRPPAVSYEADGFDAWFARQQAVSKMVDGAETRSIGLPHDGESFSPDTPGECADKLVELKALGYNVPQHAIDVLREEQAEEGEDVPVQ